MTAWENCRETMEPAVAGNLSKKYASSCRRSMKTAYWSEAKGEIKTKNKKTHES